MAENNEIKKVVPPYLPFKSLINFLDGLRAAMPQRIDRSLMKSYSGTMQSQLMAALEYLLLIHPETGIPTDALNRLVQSEEKERQSLFKETVTSSYRFLFENGFDLDRATPDQLQERFRQAGVSGDTLRKCVTFFLKAANAADIKLSPHFKKTYGPRTGGARGKRKINPVQEQGESPSFQEKAVPPPKDEISVAKILSDKFPAFNPEWSEEVQKKWFDGFGLLMEQVKKKTDTQ